MKFGKEQNLNIKFDDDIEELIVEYRELSLRHALNHAQILAMQGLMLGCKTKEEVNNTKDNMIDFAQSNAEIKMEMTILEMVINTLLRNRRKEACQVSLESKIKIKRRGRPKAYKGI